MSADEALEAAAGAEVAAAGKVSSDAPWTAEQIVAAETAHASGLYHKRPVVLARGEGALVWDVNGRQYIDCDTGHGVALLGHCHPAVVEAVTKQAATLLTCGESFYSEPRARLMDALAAVLPDGLGRIFLCNSGTEAIEAALKIARLTTGRKQVVATKRGFHGRTMGSLSATWNPRYRGPFEPLLEGYRHITFNSIEEAEEAITTNTAAVILEPVQGESGVFVADMSFLQRLRDLCDERGAMLVFDEVQTGVGRTGTFVAAQGFGVTPDLLCIAKGLAGGMPIGAVAIGSRVGDLERGTHASTFGGNPMACAAAAAAVKAAVDEKLPQRAAELGARFMAKLRRLAEEAHVIREVRGMGLMIGIDLRTRSAKYLQALQDRGVLALDAGPTVIRLLPPMVITWEQLETVYAALEAVLKEAA